MLARNLRMIRLLTRRSGHALLLLPAGASMLALAARCVTVLVTVAAARPVVAALAPRLVVQPAICLPVATATMTVAVTDAIVTVLAAPMIAM